MRHTEIEIGMRVMTNSSAATIVGTVTDAMDRKHTRTGRERYQFRVQWDTGQAEWLTAGELKRYRLVQKPDPGDPNYIVVEPE